MANTPDKNAPVIQISGLVKKFGKFTALDKLDMQVEKGEVHGLLGPNGAGKSTAIRVLLGLLKANAGNVTVLGKDPWRDAVELHSRLAYVPGEVNLWDTLSGGEIIDLLTNLRGRYSKTKRDALIDRFQLDPRKKFRTYSKGNRQKVALISALASDVELYILDEPTSGLDPLLELVFQDEVNELKKAGKTILLSSHILAEVEALCDHVTIIRDGQVVQSGSLDEMRRFTRTTVKATLSGRAGGLRQLAGVHEFKARGGNKVEFEVEQKHLGAALQKLSESGVEAITSHPPTLEELFMKHYKEAAVNAKQDDGTT